MKKTMVLVAGLIVSSMSFASVSHGDMNLYSSNFATKAQAYQAGFDMKHDLSLMPSSKLKQKLMATDASAYKMKIDSTKVKVEEFANNDNKIVYRAAVDVDFTYHYHD